MQVIEQQRRSWRHECINVSRKKKRKNELQLSNCLPLIMYVTASVSGGSRICKRGGKVERRRREDRGAEGAEWPSAAGASIEAPKAPRGWSLGRGYPRPNWEGSGEGHGPLPRKLFDYESENGDF